MNESTKFVIAAGGIYLCYFYFAIIQERITQVRYGKEPNKDGMIGERFTYSLIVVAIQCYFGWILARVILIFKSPAADKTFFGFYLSGAVTYLGSMSFANMALKYINYPTQVVAKSAKPIPVLILSVIWGGRSYTKKKCASVFVIVIGFIVFMYKEGGVNKNYEDELFGKVLVGLSLLCDGFSGATQERIRASSAPTAEQMMVAVNFWSSLLMTVTLGFTGQLYDFIGFAKSHPSIMFHLVSLGISAALGQFFIFMMITNFGSLSNSIVTTSRKFFTVLLSILIFGNHLSGRQWIGTILVFSGLFWDIFPRNLKKKIEFSPLHEIKTEI